MNLYNERYFVAPYNMPPNPKGVGLTFTSDRNPTSRKKDMSNQVVPGIAHSLAKVTRGMHGQYTPMDEEFFFRKYHLTEQQLGREQFEGRVKYPYTSKKRMLHQSLPRITLVGNNYYYPPSFSFIQRRLDFVTNSMESHFFDLMGAYLDEMDPTQRKAEIGKLYNKAYMGRPGLLNFLSQYLQDHFCTPFSKTNPKGKATQSTRIRQQVIPPIYNPLLHNWKSAISTPAGVGGIPGGPTVPPVVGGGPPGGPGGGGPGGITPAALMQQQQLIQQRGLVRAQEDLLVHQERFLEKQNAQFHRFFNALGEFLMDLENLGRHPPDRLTTIEEESKGESPTTRQRREQQEEDDFWAQKDREAKQHAEAMKKAAEGIAHRQRLHAAEREQIERAKLGEPTSQPTHGTTGGATSTPGRSPNKFLSYLGTTIVKNPGTGPGTDPGPDPDSGDIAQDLFPSPQAPINPNVDTDEMAANPPAMRKQRAERIKKLQGLNNNIKKSTNQYLKDLETNYAVDAFHNVFEEVMVNEPDSGLPGLKGHMTYLSHQYRYDMLNFEHARLTLQEEGAHPHVVHSLEPSYPLLNQRFQRLEESAHGAELELKSLSACIRSYHRMKKEEETRSAYKVDDPEEEALYNSVFPEFNERMLQFCKRQAKNRSLRNLWKDVGIDVDQKSEDLIFYMGGLPLVMHELEATKNIIDMNTLGYAYRRQFSDAFTNYFEAYPEEEVTSFGPLVYCQLMEMQLKYLFFRQTEEYHNFEQQYAPQGMTVSAFYEFLERDNRNPISPHEGEEARVREFFTQPQYLANQKVDDAFTDNKLINMSFGLMEASLDADHQNTIRKEIHQWVQDTLDDPEHPHMMDLAQTAKSNKSRRKSVSKTLFSP